MHIYDAKYPTDPKATLKPADALVADYKLLQKRIGTSRNVVVTPSTYGTNNRVTLTRSRRLVRPPGASPSSTRRSTDPELKRLNGLGIRGIRFNLVQAGATTAEMIEPLSSWVNDLGWHIQIHMKGEQIAEIRGPAAARALPDRVRSSRAARTAQRPGQSGFQNDQQAH